MHVMSSIISNSKELRWGGTIRNKNSFCEQLKTMYQIMRVLFHVDSEIVRFKVRISVVESSVSPF